MLRTAPAILVLLLGLCLTASSAPPETVGIPLKPDPPIAVDGNLGDWERVPNARGISAPEQAVWGANSWTGPADLQGTVRLAWRQEYLFIAAEVVDDTIHQTQRGANIWRGDHIELYLDAAPDLDPGRETFGPGQFQLALSPGNFQNSGDAFTDCPPEAYCYRPEAQPIEGALAASVRTAEGYILEAAIPWTFFGVTPEVGAFLRIEVTLSDTDGPEARQEAMLALSSAPWGHSRSRLIPALLSGTDGVPPERANRVPLFDEVRLQRDETKAMTITAPPTPEGKLAVLFLKARLDTERVAGHTPALRLLLNGQPLTGERMVDKPARVLSRNGAMYSMHSGERLTTYYAPDFEKADQDTHYGLLEGVKACEFQLDVTGVLHEGENTLTIENAAAPTVERVLVAGDGALVFRTPPPPPRPKAGPPTGPLEVYVPLQARDTAFDFRELENACIEVTVAGESFVVESRFSCPEPAWKTGSCDYFRHSRKVTRLPEGLEVTDTFTNLTGGNLALMHRHEVQVEGLQGLWLAGLPQPGLAGKSASSHNPTTFGTTSRAGVGLLPREDVFRIHVANYAMNNSLGLADNNLVLPPGREYSARWLIVPTETPDYWRFINAARRLMNANFCVDGGFAFLRADTITDKWSDELLSNFLNFKDPLYVCASIGHLTVNGEPCHGTGFQQVPHDSFKTSFARFRGLYPKARYLVYFHCFLDVTEDGPERFADARTLGVDGKQADYGSPKLRLFIPTETNSYGPAVAKNVDIILDDIGADGVYWDEHGYSRVMYHFGGPWDGVSGDIDPKTMDIVRLKSSVTLLSESWRVALAKRILARGPLIGNGAPFTQAMADLHFPCFVETGSITNCTHNHLYSPIALGDHLTERSELHAYRVMLSALNYGCLYHWYNDVLVIPTHHHLTRYMYPFTPLELHEGYVIGEERIITNRSGLFGWGDASRHEVHVFDGEGREVESFEAPWVNQDGKTYTELRIAEDWSAAIIRK